LVGLLGGGGEFGDGVAGEIAGVNGAWEGVALLLALGMTGACGVRAELLGEILGLELFGLTVKSNAEGVGKTGAALSVGAGEPDDCVTGMVTVSVPGVVLCANAAGGRSGATIANRETAATNLFKRTLAFVVSFILIVGMITAWMLRLTT
jgi:hypothetical protein